MAMVAPAEGDLTTFYYECAQRSFGEPPPFKALKRVRYECEVLLRDGSSPRAIRRGIELLVRKRKAPHLLSLLVLDGLQGQSACIWCKHPDKMRLTPDQLRECGCTDCLETVLFSEVA
jgi:hypothetical protein